MIESDVLVIGAGLSGLTCAALLAERGLSVRVLEACATPGGSCSSFRRGAVTYDLGAALLFGFDGGFSPHRYLMDELGEPVDVYRHEAPYSVRYGERRIVFHRDVNRFIDELAEAFPGTRDSLRAFYDELYALHPLIAGSSASYVPPSEMRLKDLAPAKGADPCDSLKALTLLAKSAESLARKHLRDVSLIRFFDKLTSTYCYTTMPETPAVLAVTMFVENHEGGAYSIAGGPAMLAGRLEKAVEDRGGSIEYGAPASRILFDGRRAVGAATEDGREFRARDVVFTGALSQLASGLVPERLLPRRWKKRVLGYEMTYRNFMVYGTVDRAALPPDAMPIEVFIDNKEAIDEGDVTLYLESLEDPRLAPEGRCSFMLLGPTFSAWPAPGSAAHRDPAYEAAKQAEGRRILGLVDRRWPGFAAAVGDAVLASPTTVERYLRKPGGVVAGPKQALGQALLKRPGARSPWPGLWFAGEWTTMGTGTPAVTVSGIGAADRVLRERGLPEFRNVPRGNSVVRLLPAGTPGNVPASAAGVEASRCRWCEEPPCALACPAGIDVPGALRRLECGNEAGAARRVAESDRGRPGREPGRVSCVGCAAPCLEVCVRHDVDGRPVAIAELLSGL